VVRSFIYIRGSVNSGTRELGWKKRYKFIFTNL